MPNVNLNDPQYFLKSIDDPIKKFNMFIRKWCPDAAHLLDSDQNDGQLIRNMLADLFTQAQVDEAVRIARIDELQKVCDHLSLDKKNRFKDVDLYVWIWEERAAYCRRLSSIMAE